MIVEEMIRTVAQAWRRSVEVPVTRPARGFIDVVFDEPTQSIIVATEVQSRLDRLEQQVRWAQDKAQSLPSADLWRFLAGAPTITRLLVLRSTVANRDLARRVSDNAPRGIPIPERGCPSRADAGRRTLAGRRDPLGGRTR